MNKIIIIIILLLLLLLLLTYSFDKTKYINCNIINLFMYLLKRNELLRDEWDVKLYWLT